MLCGATSNEDCLYLRIKHSIYSVVHHNVCLICSSVVLCTFVCVAGSSYEFIIAETKGEKKNVGVITLNRPKALNALCDGLMREVSDAVEKFENDDSVGALVITGSEKAFAAGKQPH
jgi:hypothetical protein